MNNFIQVSCEGGNLKKVTNAGLFLFRKNRNNYEYLLLKDTYKCNTSWSPPKGRMIIGKNFLETAKIATKSFTGYTSSDYYVYERHTHILKCRNDVGSQNATIMYYLAELSNGDKQPVLRSDRHSAYAWATSEDACRLMGFFEQLGMFRFFRDIIHRKPTRP